MQSSDVTEKENKRRRQELHCRRSKWPLKWGENLKEEGAGS